MFEVQTGQCGVCTHFGEHHPQEEELVQIHQQHKAPEDFVDECGHPQHAALNLKVTAISGCDAFEPVSADGPA